MHEQPSGDLHHDCARDDDNHDDDDDEEEEEEEDTSKSMSIRLQPQEWFLENKITWVTMLAVLAAVQVRQINVIS